MEIWICKVAPREYVIQVRNADGELVERSRNSHPLKQARWLAAAYLRQYGGRIVQK